MASLLLLAGCTADEQDEGNGIVPLSLSAEIQTEEVTRAGTALLNSFSSGEQLGIILTNCVNSSGAALSTTTYTVGTGFATQPYISAGKTATVKGYYPSSAASALSFTVSSDQRADGNPAGDNDAARGYKGSDLMFAEAQDATKASSSPTLTFVHKMAKLIVNVTAGSGISSITSVTLNNIDRTVGWTASTGSLGALSNSGDIVMSNNGAALIPPQTTSASNNFLTIVTSAGTATYKLGKTFASGSVYTLNITVGLANIGTSTTITGWTGNESTVNVQPTVEVVGFGAVPGLFSVSSGTKVVFAQGNLQATYDGTSWTWAFAPRQWSYIGNAAANTLIDANGLQSGATGTVDLFGWVGNSSTALTSVPGMYGISNSTTSADYGNNSSDALKSDWGTLIGSGWRTLTSGEWTYVFNSRTTTTTNMPTGTNSSAARYTKASVAGVSGVILFPDNYAHPDGVTVTVSDAAYNTASNAYNTFTVDATNWAAMESSGCVFLPAAGYRNGTAVNLAGSYGYYWSSTASGTSNAYGVYFYSGYLGPAGSVDRYRGYSVRLVRQVE